MGQKVSLYQGLSLRENLEFYAGLYGLDGRRRSSAAGASCASASTSADVEHEKASDLPAGVRQRAGLALSTLHRPRVLFLDEPTAGVDLHNRLLFWNRIREEAAAGVTVFVTTHFLEEVEYCDWVCFIDAGRLIANAPPEEIRRRFSDGYRVTLALAARRARRDRRNALVARGRRGDAERRGPGARAARRSRRSSSTSSQHLADANGGTHVTIERPEMTDVFRRLMLGRDRASPPRRGRGAGAPPSRRRPARRAVDRSPTVAPRPRPRCGPAPAACARSCSARPAPPSAIPSR